jgi:hypothetical protein
MQKSEHGYHLSLAYSEKSKLLLTFGIKSVFNVNRTKKLKLKFANKLGHFSLELGDN